MTEAEWLVATDPTPMLYFIRRAGAGDRKLRLFGSSCYRSLWAASPVPEVHWDVLRASESYADREVSKQEFRLIRKRVGPSEPPKVSGMAEEVAGRSSSDCLGTTWVRGLGGLPLGGELRRSRPEQAGPQCNSLRDIFGNPFRPVAFSPSWRTDTAVALARQMYESRDFSAMPILADALQDAGCDNEDILTHCRGPGPHVRGCWVVDLVLGKQ
jgi:hypothetical protein